MNKVTSLDFSNNKKLEKLSIVSTFGLKKITGLKELSELKELTISSGDQYNSISLEELEDLGSLPKLEKLTLKNLGWNAQIKGLEKLPNLQRVDVEGFSDILVKNRNVKVNPDFNTNMDSYSISFSMPVTVKYFEDEDN